jgi:hypothetical protein
MDFIPLPKKPRTSTSSSSSKPSSSRDPIPTIFGLSEVATDKTAAPKLQTIAELKKVDRSKAPKSETLKDNKSRTSRTKTDVRAESSKKLSNKTAFEIPLVDTTKTPIYARSIFFSQKDAEMAARQTKIEELNDREKLEQNDWVQEQIKRMGACPANLKWKRKEKYYQCEGEHHIITDVSLADGRGAMYLHPKTLMPTMPEDEPLWGPYYRDPKDGRWKWVPGMRKPQLAPDWYEGTEMRWYKQRDEDYFQATYWEAVAKLNPKLRSEFLRRAEMEYPREKPSSSSKAEKSRQGSPAPSSLKVEKHKITVPSSVKVEKPRTAALASRTPTPAPKSHIPMSAAPALTTLPRTAITRAPTQAPSYASVTVNRADDFEMMRRQTKISTMSGSELRKQQSWAQKYIDETSPCPQGVKWRRFKYGYLCEGGVHAITDDAIAEGKGAIYIYPKALTSANEYYPLWGPYYRNARFDRWKHIPGARQSGVSQYPDANDKVYEYAGPRPKPSAAPDAWDDTANTLHFNKQEEYKYSQEIQARTQKSVGNTFPNQHNMKKFVAALREKVFPGGGAIDPPLDDDIGAITVQPGVGWFFIPCAGRKGQKRQGYMKTDEYRDNSSQGRWTQGGGGGAGGMGLLDSIGGFPTGGGGAGRYW